MAKLTVNELFARQDLADLSSTMARASANLKAGFSGISIPDMADIYRTPNMSYIPDTTGQILDAIECKPISPLIGKLTLDETGVIILANAIRLSYIFGLVVPRIEAKRQKKRLSDREFFLWRSEQYKSDQRIKLERSDYFTFMDRFGICDERISGQYRVGEDYQSEHSEIWFNRMVDLIESKEDISAVKFVDIEFSLGQIETYQLHPDPHGKRTPIARQAPNDLTRALKQMVIDYFEAGSAKFVGSLPLQSAKRKGNVSKNANIIERVCPIAWNYVRDGYSYFVAAGLALDELEVVYVGPRDIERGEYVFFTSSNTPRKSAQTMIENKMKAMPSA